MKEEFTRIANAAVQRQLVQQIGMQDQFKLIVFSRGRKHETAPPLDCSMVH